MCRLLKKKEIKNGLNFFKNLEDKCKEYSISFKTFRKCWEISGRILYLNDEKDQKEKQRCKRF